MKNQKGYVIQIVLIVFAVIIGLMIFPVKFPDSKNAECRVGVEVDPEKEPPVFLPPIINLGKPRLGYNGGWDETQPNVPYLLLRKDVPIFTNTTDPRFVIGYPDYTRGPAYAANVKWPIIADVDYLGRNADTRHTLKYQNANQPGFDVYFPNTFGEIELPRSIIDRNGQSGNILTLRTEGFLLFVHLGDDNKPVKLTYGQHTYYLVDFYQDKSMYETPSKGYELDDMFHCLDPEAPAMPSVIVPDQEKSLTKEQLQLEWFSFSGKAGMYAHCKPAVYLYPQTKQLVNVKVFPKGELSYTDPPYDNEKGWTVNANPDGKLFTMSYEPITNNYLYYESKILDLEIKKPTEGWVVKFDGLEELFSRVPPELGLNQKEQKDFMDYWLGKLPESPYYYVGLVEKEQRDYLEPLSVTPNPKTSIRFSLYFEMLDQPKEVEAPIIETPIRNGFTLVDWGGMIKLNPGTPFTCSQ